MDNIVTPVKVDQLELLLRSTLYDQKDSLYLIAGFRTGFDLEYQGNLNRRDRSKNLPFREGVGSPRELWSKMTKEVQLGRYA